MPRGRHRQSPPLHRLLPPVSIAGASLACAAGAWFVGDDLVQRVLAGGAAAAATGGAVLLRAWDRSAGKRVAELTKARSREEWKTEERIADLESDVEESREIRAALDTKLRAKRAELARLRSEHAELLRRYATAETERASALEGRRLLALEAAAPAEDGADVAEAERPTASDAPTPAAYARAADALRRLARNAARQERGEGGAAEAGTSKAGTSAPEAPKVKAPKTETAEVGTVEAGAAGSGEVRAGASGTGAAGSAEELPEAAGEAAVAAREGGTSQGGAKAPAAAASGAAADRPGAKNTAGVRGGKRRPATAGGSASDAADRPEPGAVPGSGAVPGAGAVPGPRRIPVAPDAIAPRNPGRFPASRVTGGFDFFGTGNAGPKAAEGGDARRALSGGAPVPPTGPGVAGPRRPVAAEPPAPLEEDLADVVGDEAVAEQSARGARTAPVPSGLPKATPQPTAAAKKPTAAAPSSKKGDQVPAQGTARTAADGTSPQPAAEEAADAAPEDGDGVSEVIDLTAHDETEQFDVADLRSAVSS
ncbi:hypothetical protein [Streptomyces sp. NPDC003077]|uniref:hypothetical protein n=1 Tax=Streptomyces sp. NPDC003077 TaxID=3154443 RepID=UPI0033BC0634